MAFHEMPFNHKSQLRKSACGLCSHYYVNMAQTETFLNCCGEVAVSNINWMTTITEPIRMCESFSTHSIEDVNRRMGEVVLLIDLRDQLREHLIDYGLIHA